MDIFVVGLIILFAIGRMVEKRRKPPKKKDRSLFFGGIDSLLDAVDEGGPDSLVAQDILEDVFGDDDY